ncbi:hypothetical protein LSAT2_005454 [Lamellibrachia satsuma]|nr:hypothetical protein LSAT2_005454 [Lamellibrachia satsuma]
MSLTQPWPPPPALLKSSVGDVVGGGGGGGGGGGMNCFRRSELLLAAAAHAASETAYEVMEPVDGQQHLWAHGGRETPPDRREPLSRSLSVLPESPPVLQSNGRLTYSKRAAAAARNCTGGDKSSKNDTPRVAIQAGDIYDIERYSDQFGRYNDTTRHAAAALCTKHGSDDIVSDTPKSLAESGGGGGGDVVVGGVGNGGDVTESSNDTCTESSGNNLTEDATHLKTASSGQSKEPIGTQHSLQLSKCHNRRLKLRTVFHSWPSTCSR